MQEFGLKIQALPMMISAHPLQNGKGYAREQIISPATSKISLLFVDQLDLNRTEREAN